MTPIPNSVVLVPKNQSWLMRLLRRLMPPNTFSRDWTTFRWPWQDVVHVYYPKWLVDDPFDARWEPYRVHEFVHAEELKTWWGPWKYLLFSWLLPLPIFFSGRWFIERRAYLKNLLRHDFQVEDVVNVLWYGYGWCWPRSWMRQWFHDRVPEAYWKRT